jgi:hypothetical protein
VTLCERLGASSDAGGAQKAFLCVRLRYVGRALGVLFVSGLVSSSAAAVARPTSSRVCISTKRLPVLMTRLPGIKI